MDDELRGRVIDWIADDPDPLTREELADLLDRADEGSAAALDDLADRFDGSLAFGTAGLRGALGAGPRRMNLAVVIRVTAGIASWLLDGAGADPAARRAVADRGVVIGFDARHRSADFAEASAATFAAAGIRARLLPGPVPTPVLAFAVRHLGTAAGIMVTASHNPGTDNGCKVYDGSGRQIVAPDDTSIAAAMDAVGLVSMVPRTGEDDPDLVRTGDEVLDAYVARAAAAGVVPAARAVAVASTAMHGVGADPFRRVMATAGFDPPVEVAAQSEPDPAFATLVFPNPEEPGAMDAVVALAASSGADVALAHDPDADRLGVAVPDPSLGPPSTPDGWRVLQGDEIGVILANHLLAAGAIGADDVLATTIVSSRLLGRMAAAAGVPYVETLTGFKWISRAPGPGRRLGFGYEEALGFCVGDLVGDRYLVRDKDGITAGLVFAEAVAVLGSEGRTVLDVLDDLARAHGVHLTAQRSVRFAGGPAATTEAMTRLRAHPPTDIAGRPVTAVIDLAGGDPARNLPPTDLVELHVDGARLAVRPSGTEPKLKTYIESVERVEPVEPVESAGQPDPLATARTRAAATVADLLDWVDGSMRAWTAPRSLG